MNAISKGLLVIFALTSSIASADFLGEADDSYLGVQMTMPLDSKPMGIFSGRNQYNYLLIEQKDGIKEGIALTHDSGGNKTLNYLRPSATFDIIDSRFPEYAVPILRLDGEVSTSNNPTNYAAAGLVALVVVGIIAKRDLEKDWKVAD
ncbi:MAG: hypothetical protein OER98_02450 [Gammaproteobacteria bacterium]|nr:hypothetical protein [Gammaproteobacteria bacterium]